MTIFVGNPRINECYVIFRRLRALCLHPYLHVKAKPSARLYLASLHPLDLKKTAIVKMSQKPGRQLHIVPKVLMFALYIVQCSAPSYLSLIYQQKLKLPFTMIGVIASIPPFLCVIAGPGLSLVADITGRPRLVLSVAMVTTTLTLWLFILLPLDFASACGIAVLYAITSAPIGSMMDVIVLTMLGDESIL